jgi:predicted RNA-binding protein with TRAM domain
MNTTLAAIENINLQIDTISKELAKYGWDNDDVKILLSITGIDVFSAMLIATEIVDVKRFCYVDSNRGFDPKPVETGKEYDIEVTEVSRQGDGIARVQGFVIFVKNGKPGQKVKVHVDQVGSRFATATIVTQPTQ